MYKATMKKSEDGSERVMIDRTVFVLGEPVEITNDFKAQLDKEYAGRFEFEFESLPRGKAKDQTEGSEDNKE